MTPDRRAQVITVLNLKGVDTLIEFHVVKEADGIMQILKPKMEALTEMPAAVLTRSWVSRTSTVNFRARKDLAGAKLPFTRLLWAEGHWDAKTIT